MKKSNFAKIVSLVFVCAMLLCALAVTALAEDETTVDIVSYNVYYGEKYQLMFAVNAPDGADISVTDAEGNELAYGSFAEDPNPVIDEVTCKAYIVKDGVAAQAIEEVVTFTVEYNGTVVSKSYSVLQYITERTNGTSSNQATGAELEMFNALLAYAEKSDIFIDGTAADKSISSYKYVTVVGGTLDGNNTAGMFALNSTPFANIEATIEVGASQSVGWTISIDGADASEISLADLKAHVVKGNTVVTATAVNNVCDHSWTEATCSDAATCTKCGAVGEKAEHSWKDADCTNPKTCEVCGATDGNAAGHKDQNADYICDVCKIEFKATLSFASTDNRVSLSNDEQVWSANGVTFVNSKSSSTTNVGDYSNPIRLYKASKVVVEYPSMVKIVFNCNSPSYAGELKNSIGDDATVSGSAVTVVLAEQTDSYTISALSAQVRINSIDVYYTVLPKCEHTNTEPIPAVEADCTNTGLTEGAKCVDCGNTVTPQTVVDALGHTEETVTGYAATCAEDGLSDGKVCSVCEEVLVAQETLPATGEHNDGTGDGLCDVCKLDLNTDDAKAESVLAGIQPPPTDVTAAGEVELDTTNNTGYTATITWSIEGGTNTISKLTDNKLNVALDGTDTTIILKVSVTVGDATVTKEYTINVAAGVKEPVKLATFEFGENGTASHYDGSSATSYTETNNNYTLTLSSMSKAYSGARDEKGNSCLKLGTNSAVGGFSFTVGDDVDQVVIYIAKYKANTTKISVNGTSYTLTNASNDGAYDAITIDTSTTKTVTLTTVSGGARAMVNTIEFWG